MLPDAGGAVRGPQGWIPAVPGEELRRLQRDVLAEELPGPGCGGSEAGRREEEVHQNVRREAVVVGADGEPVGRGACTRVLDALAVRPRVLERAENSGEGVYSCFACLAVRPF